MNIYIYIIKYVYTVYIISIYLFIYHYISWICIYIIHLYINIHISYIYIYIYTYVYIYIVHKYHTYYIWYVYIYIIHIIHVIHIQMQPTSCDTPTIPNCENQKRWIASHFTTDFLHLLSAVKPLWITCQAKGKVTKKSNSNRKLHLHGNLNILLWNRKKQFQQPLSKEQWFNDQWPKCHGIALPQRWEPRPWSFPSQECWAYE